MTVRALSIALFLGALAAGCGSKISEPNYYRIQHGMTEDDVDDLLGPAVHEDVSPPPAMAGAPSTQTTARKTKTWTRGRLTIRVEFDNGLVVARSADGIPFEGEARQAAPATAPTAG